MSFTLGKRERDANSDEVSLRDCGEILYRAMAEEEGACDKGSCEGKDRWSSCMDDGIDEAFSSMDDCHLPDFGDEWRTWHMNDLDLESDERRLKKG